MEKQKAKRNELSTASKIFIVIMAVFRVAFILFVPTMCAVIFLSCQASISLRNGFAGPTGTISTMGSYILLFTPIFGLIVATIGAYVVVFRDGITEVTKIAPQVIPFVAVGMIFSLIIGYLLMLT